MTESKLPYTPTPSVSLIKDGLENLIAQLGTQQDKRAHSRFSNRKGLSLAGNKDELDSMYTADWLSRKVVDIIPDDMTREWREFNGELDTDILDTIYACEDDLGIQTKVNLAHKWARLYGAAYIVMNIDDGQTPDRPLKLSAIKQGGLRNINVIDRHQISHSNIRLVQDPMSPVFGLPEAYRFNESNVIVHHSRVLRFDGAKIPYNKFRENNYNHNSVLEALYESLINFGTATTSAASMIYEASIDVVQVRGLMNHLLTEEGEKLLIKRFTLANMLKSINNALILDQEETYTKHNQTFAGLPDLIDRFSQILAAATDIPATRLLGNSASGLNATGEGDLKNYYDMIRAKQKSTYKPVLDYFDQIMFASLGYDYDALDATYEFRSLFQMTETQQADLELKRAQRDEIYLTNGVITEEIVAKQLRQDDIYTNMDDYITSLEELENGLVPTNSERPEAEENEGEEGSPDEGAKESGGDVPETATSAGEES